MTLKKKAQELEAKYAAAGQKRDDNNQIKALVSTLRRLRKERDVLLAIKATPIKVKTLRRPMVDGKRQVAVVAVASDWHGEERVDPRIVNGLNRYNPAIAEFRARRFFECIRSLVHAYKRFEVRSLTLALIGDLITGWIHEELQASNYMSPVEASAFVFRLLSEGIEYLERECPNAELSFVCVTGNHGRTSLKRRVADPAATSYEWLVYHLLAQRFPQHVWQVEQGLHAVIDIYGVRIHTTHGDVVKASTGVLGVVGPLYRAATGWRDTYKADTSIVGHWHQYTPTPRVLINGSLIGYSAFAASLPLATPEDPCQALFFVDAKRGICAHHVLWVGDPSEEKNL